MVIHGYLSSGQSMPEIQVRRTLSPAGPYDPAAAAITDARIEVGLDGEMVRYLADSSRRGTYRPQTGVQPRAGQSYTFRAFWDGKVAETSGTIPPEIELLDVTVTVPDEPVSAVLLDSLALSDSLTTGFYTGYIYPIEVQVTWKDAPVLGWTGADAWIRAQLKPFSAFSSPVVDLFLRSDEIFRESVRPLKSGRRTWTGMYAVGVAGADDPLPEHRLRVSLVRSGPDYARFAASKHTPERREPISNLSGAVGIVAAIAVDSTHLYVGPQGASATLLTTH